MRGPGAEVGAIVALATIVTLVLAAPVLRAPSERVFGAETVGRHHDPFTVMEQLERPIAIGVYSQPATDIPAALFARLVGGVAAYNWLVLISFPLSAAGAYLLARYLGLSPAGAAVAALAYAFSPFHLAHAAYHPHVAQTQWVPLYLLALWRCLDLATPGAIGLLCAAIVAVALSNFYGGWIVAVITPVAVAAYCLAASRTGARWTGRLVTTAGSLALVAAAGIAYISYAASGLVAHRAAYAFPYADLFLYSANWRSYLISPISHPLLGDAVRRFWDEAGVHEGLLEQQVSLGWGLIGLGAIAVGGWFWRERQQVSLARVPLLVAVALTALVCSLPPERTIAGFTFSSPSALLYQIAPMFRAYARFGVVVHLMVALLAGIGVDWLRRAGTRRTQAVCLTLVAMVIAEYAVMPAALWRDVLPTAAHRWVAQQPARIQAFDCTPLTQQTGSVQWLTGHRVTMGRPMSDCTEPNLSQTLAAAGYTHLIVPRQTPDGRWFSGRPAQDGLRVVATFVDGWVFAVVDQGLALQTAATTGFFPREHNAEWSWRWMGADAAWTVANASPHSIVATVGVEMLAFYRPRRVDLRLDGQPVQTLVVDLSRRIYQIGPMRVGPGNHQLEFVAADAPTVAGEAIGNGDPRPLSVAIGAWTWVTSDGERP